MHKLRFVTLTYHLNEYLLYSNAIQEIQFSSADNCHVTGKLLEKVLEYLYYRYKHTDSGEEIPDFAIDEEIVLDLLSVANYLGLNY